MTTTTRLAGKLAALGAIINTGLFDLAIALEPRLGRRHEAVRFRTSPWIGLVVIVVAAVGLATIGIGAVDALAVMTRLGRSESQP